MKNLLWWTTKSFFLVAVILFCVDVSPSQSPADTSIPIGKVVETVLVQTRPDQSYAAFLPTGYTPDRRWPTIFCLDPRARGRIAIERFVEAAQKYGYIIVCSNNSRNGLDGPTITQIFTDFWNDAHSRFSIDEKRTYAAGFSGGARLSVTFASRCRGCLAGVIAGGAGFPLGIDPDSKTSFAFFGVAGVDDFNFGEMWNLEKKLSELKVPHRFEAISGGHEWTPKDAIQDGVAWLSLQAIKAGLTKRDERDEKFIDEQLTSRMNAAERLFSQQQFADSYRAYRSIARDFDGLRDVKVANERSEELAKNDQFRKDEKANDEDYKKQLREAGEIRALWQKPFSPDETRSFRSEASIRISEWRKKKEGSVDSRDRRLARRILSQLLVGAYEAAQPSLQARDYNLALTEFQLAKEIDPKSANVNFEIARVYALKRQKKSALDSLEEAVSLGFKDLNRLKAEEAFAGLTDEPRYQKLLTSLAGN
jgi:predicted esterase